MKPVIAALSLCVCLSSFAECPDLSGSYICEGDSIFFQPNEAFSISQKSEDGKTEFTFGNDPDPLTVTDGKVALEPWSGGLTAQQTACEKGTLLFRSGVEVFFAHEVNFSKRSDGALLFKSYELDPENEDSEKARVEALIDEWQKFTESLQGNEMTKEKVLELARTFATDKSLALFEQMKKEGLLAVREVVCRKQP